MSSSVKCANERHRRADVAQHDQLGLCGLPRAVVGVHQHAAAGQRTADRPPEVELAAPADARCVPQPGGEPLGQRLHLATQVDEFGARGAQEGDLVDARPRGRPGDRLRPRSRRIRRRTSVSTSRLEGPAGRRSSPGNLLGQPAVLLIGEERCSSSCSRVCGESRRNTAIGEPRLPAGGRVPVACRGCRRRRARTAADRVLDRRRAAGRAAHRATALVRRRGPPRAAAPARCGAGAAPRSGSLTVPSPSDGREVQVEDGVERGPVDRPLDERRGVGGAQGSRGRSVGIARIARPRPPLGGADRSPAARSAR